MGSSDAERKIGAPRSLTENPPSDPFHSMNAHCEHERVIADAKPAKLPRISAELFTIPVEDAYLVYAPLRRAAFLANAAVVNFLAELQDGHVDTGAPEHADLVELAHGWHLRRLGDGGRDDEIAGSS